MIDDKLNLTLIKENMQ